MNRLIALGLAILASTVYTDDEIMKNLSKVSWAHAVNNKTYLEAALASELSMLEADIVMGHLRGASDGPIIPIMAHPPSTTSDLSLAEFLKSVASHNKKSDKTKGVKLDFKTIEAFEKSQDIMTPYTKQDSFPVWLNADILPGPVAATTTPVDPDKFLKLCVNHPKAVLSLGWTTNYGENVKEGEYSRDEIGKMLQVINQNGVRQTITFPVRAALASNSQPVILDLLRETARLNSTITVWSAEGDRVQVARLRALLLTAGLEKCYLDVPASVAADLKLPQ